VSNASALPVLALHRYWLWADFHKKVMLEQGPPVPGDGEHPAVTRGRNFDAISALGFFYASLFVVIEGWRELGLEDEEINGLIASENTDLLRRFRNGIFHFQPGFDDKRFLGFLDDAEQPVDWARALHAAFARWFQDWGRATFGFGPEDLEAWLRAELKTFEATEQTQTPSKPPAKATPPDP
jgi:hypothetical protein